MSTRRTAVGALAAALLVAGCGGSEGSGRTELKLTVLPTPHVAPAYLADREGWFEEAGLDVELSVAQTGAVTTAELVSGASQFGFASPVPIMVGQTRGIGIEIVCGATAEREDPDQQSVALVAASDVASLTDLEGQKVAVNALQAADELTARAVIDDSGADSSKVSFVALPYPEMVESLSSGRVFAAAVSEPFLSQAVAQGMAVIAHPNTKYGTAGTSSVWVASSEYASASPQVVEQFCGVIDKASTYANDHPDEMRELISDYTGIPAEVADTMRLIQWSADVNRDTMDWLADALSQYQFVDSRPDVDVVLWDGLGS